MARIAQGDQVNASRVNISSHAGALMWTLLIATSKRASQLTGCR